MDYVTLAVICIIAIFLLGWKLKWVFKKIILICVCAVILLGGIWFLQEGIIGSGNFLDKYIWSWFSS